jgi:hypothetical protein
MSDLERAAGQIWREPPTDPDCAVDDGAWQHCPCRRPRPFVAGPGPSSVSARASKVCWSRSCGCTVRSVGAVRVLAAPQLREMRAYGPETPPPPVAQLGVSFPVRISAPGRIEAAGQRAASTALGEGRGRVRHRRPARSRGSYRRSIVRPWGRVGWHHWRGGQAVA